MDKRIVNIKIIVLLIVAGILFSGCMNKEGVTEDSIIENKGDSIDRSNEQVYNISNDNNTYKNDSGRLDIFMKLEKSNFSVGEEIKINLGLINKGKYPINIDDNGTGHFEIRVYPINNSINITSPISIKDPYFGQVTVRPGEVLTEGIRWNQRYKINNTEGMLEPGKYQLVAYLKAVVLYQNSGNPNDILQLKSNTLRTNPLIINIENNR